MRFAICYKGGRILAWPQTFDTYALANIVMESLSDDRLHVVETR